MALQAFWEKVVWEIFQMEDELDDLQLLILPCHAMVLIPINAGYV